jgi:predicted Zn-dependent protease
MKILRNIKIAVYILTIFAIQSCSRNPVTGKKEIIFMTQDKEIALGQQSHPSVVASMGLYDDKKLQSFISEKGMAMAKISHRPDLPYQFFIVDSPVVNAFAVPGGYVYFTRGIMAHFNNEAEFAGVLGHEIGHITARHSARQQTSQILGQVGLMAGMVLSEQFRQMSDIAQQGLGTLLLSYSRAHETESDKIGVDYSSKIGYDARQMADFFGTLKRLSDKSGQSIPTFQSTHPDPGDRQVKVRSLADAYQNTNKGTYAVNRDSYLKLINGIVYGEDPKQGFVENNVFYHPELRFQLPVPKDWQYENTPMQLQMAAKDGKSMILFTLSEGKSLQAAMDSTIKKYNFKVLENNKTTINGNSAIVLVSQQQSTDQQAQDPAKSVQIASWLIQYAGNIYAIHGMSYATDFAASLPTFKGVSEGFKALSDPDKLNRKPDRIQIRTVSRNSTFKEAMKELKMPDNRIEELGILNQMKADDQVAKGTLIKVIGK